MPPIPCTLTYRIHGIANAAQPVTQINVCEEVQEVLSHAGPVSAKPFSGGLELSVSVKDIEPFTQEQFEPYVYEHIIWHVINACCEMQGDGFKFELVSAKFG